MKKEKDDIIKRKRSSQKRPNLRLRRFYAQFKMIHPVMSLLMKRETRSLQIQIHVNDMFLFFQYTYLFIIHSDNILFLNLLISMKHCFEYLNASTTKKADSFLFFRENRKIIVIIFLIKETNFNFFFSLYSFTKWFNSAFRMLDIVQR